MEKLNESIYSMYQKWSSGNVRKEDYHEYVDLGLPSGLLWATCNIGADTPTQFGDYFQWASVKIIESEKISEMNAPYLNDDAKYIKYISEDGLKILEPKDDVAHVLWGGKWRMPTKIDVGELINCTTFKWSKEGLTLKSKSNDNELFIPHAGFAVYGKIYDDVTCFWTSDKTNRMDNDANDFQYNRRGVPNINYASRYIGMPVRCVMDKK